MGRFPCDIDEGARARIVAALHRSYSRYDPAHFECDAAGRYPKLGEGKFLEVLDWLYPALHLTLEPRPGQEKQDRTLARNMVLRAIRQGMFRADGDPLDGLWEWSNTINDASDPDILRRRSASRGWFQGYALARIWDHDPQKLADWPAEDMALFKDSVRRSVESDLRYWVRVGYTNPQCMNIYTAFVAADLLNDPALRLRIREHLQKFAAYSGTTDSFEEWISPTYLSVNLAGLVPLAHYTRNTPDAALTAQLLKMQWRLVAAAAHGPTQEICGPHSRAYGDTAIELVDHAYAWLHLAAPDAFKLNLAAQAASDNDIYHYLPKDDAVFTGMAAAGIYVPMNIPGDARAAMRSDFQSPVEGRENFEWVGRCSWTEPFDLTRPSEPAPRFRLGTRYRAAKFCVGSANELDGWVQRRPCLAYWKDARGATTGLKWHVVVDAGEEAAKFLGDWLFMEAIEFISVQSGPEVVGAFRLAPIVPARPGDRLKSPAETFRAGKTGMFKPKNPVGWFLGTHWRQPIEPDWQRQKVRQLWVGVTPVGGGAWTRLDEGGTRWVFAENGIETVIETPRGAKLTPMPNRTAAKDPLDCLELYSARDLDWDWLRLPEIFTPFGAVVQESGGPRRFGLQATGDSGKCELSRGDLRVQWTSPSRPHAIEERTWRGYVGGREILPPGFSR